MGCGPPGPIASTASAHSGGVCCYNYYAHVTYLLTMCSSYKPPPAFMRNFMPMYLTQQYRSSCGLTLIFLRDCNPSISYSCCCKCDFSSRGVMLLTLSESTVKSQPTFNSSLADTLSHTSNSFKYVTAYLPLQHFIHNFPIKYKYHHSRNQNVDQSKCPQFGESMPHNSWQIRF